MKTQHLAVAALLAFSFSALSQNSTQAQSASSILPPSSVQSARKPASPTVAANYGKLPLSFEANQGQADPRTRFLSHGAGYSLFLTDSAAVLELSKVPPASQKTPGGNQGVNPSSLATTRRMGAMKTDVVRMELAGATHNSSVAGADPLPGKSNYLIGNDSSKWHTNVPTYGKVKYSGVYPGVDLVYYGNQQQLEYDFIVAPGASAKPVRLHFAGASQLKLNSDGDLAVIAANGQISFHKPVVYQEKDGRRQPVEGKFTLLAKNTVGFQLGGYDHSRKLVIDPVLAYSTYFSAFSIVGIAVDASGSAYVAAVQPFPGFFTPTEGAFQTTPGDVVVAKLNPAGTALVYATYLGETRQYPDFNIGGIAVDSSGNAYLTGVDAVPVTKGAYDTTEFGAFLLKLNATGSALIYSTYLPGASTTAIAIDTAGHAFLTGTAYPAQNGAPGLPVTPGAFQTTFKGASGYLEAFVTEFNAQGSGLVYSTYLGGSGGDYGTGIAVDSQGSAYVTGVTGSSDFPVTSGAYVTTYNPANTGDTSFVSKLNPAGSQLAYSTFLSSIGQIFAAGIAVDGQGYAYVTGNPASSYPDVPGAFKTTPGSFEPVAKGLQDAFVTKLNLDGSALVYSTYLGGSIQTKVGEFEGYTANGSIAVDSEGRAYLTGFTFDTDFPVTPDAYQKMNNAAAVQGTNAFFTVFNAAGSGLVYSTYLGSGGIPYSGTLGPPQGDIGWVVALGPSGSAYIAGLAAAPPGGFSYFPTTLGAYQGYSDNNPAAFISRFDFEGTATTSSVVSDGNPGPAGSNVTFTAYVASNGSIPSGYVEFYIDGTLTAANPLDDTGHASYATTNLPTGPHSIKAYYRGSLTYADSSASLVETITGQVLTPNIVPVSGSYRVAQQAIISDVTGNSVIHYTTDGSTPTVSSPIYAAPIPITKATTVRAIAVAAGDTPSAVASATYAISSKLRPVTVLFSTLFTTGSFHEGMYLTAIVTTTDGTTATGTITFLHGNVPIGTASLVDGAVSVDTGNGFSTGFAAPGEYSLTASYSGSATEEAKQSAPVVVNVIE
jgi:hypothetical protein